MTAISDLYNLCKEHGHRVIFQPGGAPCGTVPGLCEPPGSRDNRQPKEGKTMYLEVGR